MENKFKIVVPFYNVEKWVKWCIRSVKSQTYTNYECYLVNDISTDNTEKVVIEEIAGNDKFHLITNTEKKYALKNIYDTLASTNTAPDDVVVILDGDDWLSGPNVLTRLNEIYKEQECWMTYGSYVEYPSQVRGKFAKKIPADIVESAAYRQSQWMSSHLRTFRHKLWSHIDPADFVNPLTGKFIKAAWDLAFVFPMLEIAGPRAHYVEDILYIYNRDNPLNEDKVDHSIQLNEEHHIRHKETYTRLEEL
jgi:glycosyltransferase involved in cell wall biosynthesis